MKNPFVIAYTLIRGKEPERVGIALGQIQKPDWKNDPRAPWKPLARKLIALHIINTTGKF